MLAQLLEARTQSLNDAAPNSDIIWICHTDDVLAEKQSYSRTSLDGRQDYFHSSGALSSDVLRR